PPSRIEQPHIVGAPSGLPGSTASTLARPHYLIYQRNLVTVSQEPGVPCMPYIAVSYAWDASSSMSLVSMADRRVTRQAYEIMLDLSQRTNLALWIDAICIRQDDKQAKERELPRMADIYRGAAAVWCLVNSVDAEVCKSVQRYVDFADRELHLSSENGAARRKLESMFMASRGAKEGLTRLFAERWWQRAWTFQEATLNPRTLLVGAVPQHRDPWARDTPGGATVPIADVLKAARFPHWLTTGLTSSEDVLKRPQTFWDALLAQAAIAGRTVGLGEAMACVWRRDATIDHDLVYSLLGVCGLSDRVEPSYDKQFNTLLCEVFNAAAVAGDYSWVPWCSEIDHGGCPEGMSIVPTPQLVKSIPTTPVKAWTTAAGLPELPSDGPLAQCGVRVLMRNLGVVDACTAPLTLQETVEHLRQLGRSADDIWDMLFGTTVGLAADVTSVLADSAIMEQLLDYALSFIYAQQNVVNGKWEVSYKLAKTPRRLAYTEYGDMAQQSWFRRRLDRLVVVSCVSGEIVVRAQDAITMGADAALFALPVTPKTEGVARDLVIVSGEKKVIRACAMGVLVRNPGVSAGERWEATLVR
ncbi:heterokaryon incompatibility protein-domain-containing protein, partial [Trametes maxima]